MSEPVKLGLAVVVTAVISILGYHLVAGRGADEEKIVAKESDKTTTEEPRENEEARTEEEREAPRTGPEDSSKRTTEPEGSLAHAHPGPRPEGQPTEEVQEGPAPHIGEPDWNNKDFLRAMEKGLAKETQSIDGIPVFPEDEGDTMDPVKDLERVNQVEEVVKSRIQSQNMDPRFLVDEEKED